MQWSVLEYQINKNSFVYIFFNSFIYNKLFSTYFFLYPSTYKTQNLSFQPSFSHCTLNTNCPCAMPLADYKFIKAFFYFSSQLFTLFHPLNKYIYIILSAHRHIQPTITLRKLQLTCVQLRVHYDIYKTTIINQKMSDTTFTLTTATFTTTTFTTNTTTTTG